MTVGGRVVASGLEDLQRGLMTLDRVVVAFSGGVDSAFLSATASQAFMKSPVPASSPFWAFSSSGWHMSMISPSSAPLAMAIDTDRFQT